MTLWTVFGTVTLLNLNFQTVCESSWCLIGTSKLCSYLSWNSSVHICDNYCGNGWEELTCLRGWFEEHGHYQS